MRKVILIIILYTLAHTVHAQDKNKIGWFLSPEAGVMFLDDHIGKNVGASLGVKLWNGRLKLGFYGYGRSGPINNKTFTKVAANGQSYKGKDVLSLKADHGTFGLLIAPGFKLQKIRLDVPLAIGGVAGGFYLFDEDRITPDGARVSTWENKLMDGKDAGFGTWYEIGVRGYVPLKPNSLSIGVGLHYTITSGWDTYYDPSGQFYNNKLRISFALLMESTD